MIKTSTARGLARLAKAALQNEQWMAPDRSSRLAGRSREVLVKKCEPAYHRLPPLPSRESTNNLAEDSALGPKQRRQAQA